MNTPHNNSQSEIVTGFSLRDEIQKYLKFWPWFLVCIILAVVGGMYYLKTATPIYSASASIIINEENGKASGSEMAAYGNLGFLNGMNTSSIEKEITILSSRRLMKEVVRALDLNIRYSREGEMREIEFYEDVPFSLKLLNFNEESLRKTKEGQFTISYSGNNFFKITSIKTGKVYKAKSGVPLNLNIGSFVLAPKTEKKFPEITVKISEIEKAASKYRGKVQLVRREKSSNVIEINIQDPIKDRGMDIINQLIFEYNRDAITDKNLIAGNTANFIDERLDIINNELETVETGKEEFKQSHQLTDLQAESHMYMQSASEFNKRREEIGTQIELAQAMLDFLKSNSNSDLLPANLGIQGNAVNQGISEYNDLVLERNRIMKSSTEKNPAVIRLNNHIEQLRYNINQSLQRLISNLQISRDDISRQASSMGTRILSVPTKERQYKEIERQQNIKEALYLFLLQKREENSLALAITAPKAKVVDEAYSSGGIVSPNSQSILLGSFILGFFIPFSIVYLRGVLDNKIRNRNALETLTRGIPFVGELPKVKKKKELFIKQNDRSILSEAFRILITNLQFLMVNLKDRKRGTTIFVTSTVKGEGKTFTSSNLSLTLANSGHKILLLGADLRNPKLQAFKEKYSQTRGVSDYLASDELNLHSLIDKSILHPNLDILSSGSIPPNPAELLNQEKTSHMFKELKDYYDFIIVDTAPSMLVADTFLISKYADITLYVVKAGYTEKSLMEFAVKAKESGSLQQIGMILNNVDLTNLGYGNKYGYGYGQEKKKVWQKKQELVPGLN